ncbi:MAG: hypothetical protein AVDCRST_MAG31-465, partial [uncultured Sphingomonas sp.]
GVWFGTDRPADPVAPTAHADLPFPHPRRRAPVRRPGRERPARTRSRAGRSPRRRPRSRRRADQDGQGGGWV